MGNELFVIKHKTNPPWIFHPGGNQKENKMIKNKMMNEAFTQNLDEFLLSFAKRLLEAMERKKIIDERDICNLALIILDKRIGVLDIEVTPTLCKLGLTDEIGNFLDSTGDAEKDLLVKKLLDLIEIKENKDDL